MKTLTTITSDNKRDLVKASVTTNTFKDFIDANLSPDKISDENDFYSTLINFVSNIPEVPDAMQKPVKPTYGPEPRQEDYQMPDPNRYYNAKFTNVFGNYFDVATGTFKER